MRAAILSKYDTTRADRATGISPIIEVGPVLFHEWGTEFEEFEQTAVQYSVAIVEHPDGTVSQELPRMIRFTVPADA